MLLIACTKTDKPKPLPDPPPTTPPLPPSPPPIVSPGPGDTYIKVVEYHTNLLVPNVFYSRSLCSEFNDTSCINSRYGGNWYADSNGIIYIKHPDSLGSANSGETVIDLFSKNNYWTRNGFDSLYTKDSIRRGVTTIFPFAWVKLHLKNAFYRNNTVQTIMYFNSSSEIWVFGPVGVRPFVRYNHLSLPTNNLDTTFIIKTIAFISNELDIQHDTTNELLNYYHYSVYHESRTVNKFDTLYWEVIVK